MTTFHESQPQSRRAARQSERESQEASAVPVNAAPVAPSADVPAMPFVDGQPQANFEPQPAFEPPHSGGRRARQSPQSGLYDVPPAESDAAQYAQTPVDQQAPQVPPVAFEQQQPQATGRRAAAPAPHTPLEQTAQQYAAQTHAGQPYPEQPVAAQPFIAPPLAEQLPAVENPALSRRELRQRQAEAEAAAAASAGAPLEAPQSFESAPLPTQAPMVGQPYTTPPPIYTTPPSTYTTPPSTFTTPPPTYTTPPPTYTTPPPAFPAPPSTFTTPPPAYPAPPSTFTVPPPAVQNPTHGVDAPQQQQPVVAAAPPPLLDPPHEHAEPTALSNAMAEFEALTRANQMAPPIPSQRVDDVESAAPVFVEPAVLTDGGRSAEPRTGSYVPPTGHWSRQRDMDDETQPWENTITREVGGGNVATTTSALVLPEIPSSPHFSSPLDGTGEVLLTGSIDLPRSLSSVGGDSRAYDDPQVDYMFDTQDAEFTGTDSSPVRAIRAVSTHTSARGVIHATKPHGNRMLVVVFIATGVLAVGVVGVLVAALVFNVF